MRSRTILAAVLALVASLPLGAWALATAEEPAGAPALPELPSVAEQVDGLYDADGCLLLGAGEADCSVTAEEVDEARSHGPVAEPRQLQGFTGSHWLGIVGGRGPVVLEDTLTVAPTGTFRAEGLVRNEGPHLLATIEVTARLLAADGTELGAATAVSPVHEVRPGEPVPFTVAADVDAGQVAAVAWSAAGGAAGDGALRALAWTTWWERPAGGEPVDLYLLDEGSGPRPHLVFGSVSSVGDGPVIAPEVVIAWLDADGRLVGQARADVVGPDGRPLPSLDAGAAADALVSWPSDPPADGEALIWMQGS